MKPKDILPSDYSDRIDDILDASWRIFKTRYLEGLHETTTETPFQIHFANIISVIGSTVLNHLIYLKLIWKRELIILRERLNI
jgi:hypothetical protein